jgi:hypothetical protein
LVAESGFLRIEEVGSSCFDQFLISHYDISNYEWGKPYKSGETISNENF